MTRHAGDVDSPRALTFRNAGYFFLGILVVALLGFTPAYVPGALDRPVQFSVYTHVHASLMTIWLALLISQPFLIKQRRLALHRTLGKLSYVVFPAVMIASVLLIHHRLPTEPGAPIGHAFLIPFKDLLIIGPAYLLAIVHRKTPAYHARLIVASTFQLIEPGLVRALLNFLPITNAMHAVAFTWLVIDAGIVFLIWKDRDLRRGRWIFRLLLAVTLVEQAFLLAGGPELPAVTRVAEGFAALDLT